MCIGYHLLLVQGTSKYEVLIHQLKTLWHPIQCPQTRLLYVYFTACMLYLLYVCFVYCMYASMYVLCSPPPARNFPGSKSCTDHCSETFRLGNQKDFRVGLRHQHPNRASCSASSPPSFWVFIHTDPEAGEVYEVATRAQAKPGWKGEVVENQALKVNIPRPNDVGL
jgi:hypothetical protein